MLQIFAHPNLSHQLVLVTVHSGQMTNMRENVMQSISQLEGIHISQSILNMRINNQFNKSQYFTTQVESITKSTSLTFLRGERFDRFQIEIVIQVKVRKVLPLNQ